MLHHLGGLSRVCESHLDSHQSSCCTIPAQIKWSYRLYVLVIWIDTAPLRGCATNFVLMEMRKGTCFLTPLPELCS